MSRFRRRLMGLAQLREAKRKDFVRVEYIENTNTAYIDTNVKGSNNISLQLKYIFKKNTEDTNSGFMFGSRIANLNQEYGIINSYVSPFRFGNNASLSNFIVNEDTLVTLDNTEIHNELKIFDSSNNLLHTLTTTNNSFSNNLNLYIFGMNNNGSLNPFKDTTKLYSCKIYDGTTLIRDYIPMYQISTDTYGLWDRVEKKFYTSPNGVKFTGGQRYDTTDIIEVHPKLIANTYINENSGAQQNYGGWSSSDYIDVEGFKYIQVPYPFGKNNYKYGAYYDKDKKRISNTASLTIPSNAKYVRLSTTTASFTNVWLFKRQLTTTDIYRENSYIDTNGSIIAFNTWKIFNTESEYNYFYCWIYEQSYRYQASYNADGSVYQSGKGFLERPEGGKVLLSDSNTSITYYAGYNYEYKNMNE